MDEQNIGKLARFSGISPHTIKYYEKIGLLQAERDERSNYRKYDVRVCTVLSECVKYREMGFSLKELDILIKKAGSEAQVEMMEERLRGIGREIKRLTAVQNYMQGYIKECRRVEEEEGEWYVQSWDGVAYCRMQTKSLTFSDQNLADDPVNLMDYAPETTDVLILKREYVEGGEKNFSWGKSVKFPEEESCLEGKKEYIRFAPKKVFTAYRKYTGSYVANGEMARDVRRLFREYSSELPADAYAFRLKIVHDEHGIEWNYFKIVIPLK